MKILFIGDVFGEPGRHAIQQRLSDLRKEKGIDFVVANAENAAHGRGITPKIIDELQKYGVDAFTAGNHLWDQKEIIPYISQSKILIRPANYPSGSPGQGSQVFEIYAGVKVGVVSVEGQRMMNNSVDAPYAVVEKEIQKLKGRADIVIVDFHAEATSEKRGMGWFLDGKVAAVVGTHTHVQTADEEILPQGTAYITDIGMTGPYNSMIGLDKEVGFTRLIRGMPESFKVAQGDVRLCAVLIEVDERNGKARSISRIQEKVT